MASSRWKNRRFWADKQLERVQGLKEPETEALLDLLEAFWELENYFSDIGKALSLFGSLAANRALLDEDLGNDEAAKWRWVQAKPGQIVVRDVVRVKADAYSGAEGQYHNGRIGRIVAIRSGDVHVFYEDDGPRPEMAVRHSPYSLEKRCKA